MPTFKQYDDGVGIRAVLENPDGVVDLTNATVDFYVDEHIIGCEKTDEENGEVLVTFESTHTEKVGIYKGVFRVQFDDGRRETFPTKGYEKVIIEANIGGE